MAEEENGKIAEENKEDKEAEVAESKRREKGEIEKGVVSAEITEEMQKSYIDYAMSVIVDRALPSAEDGLKPVHRRILYAMHNIGLDFSKPTKKSASVVGEVLGKFHPHGDLAVYNAMVRLAQDFSLRYPLVHGQGNFGCFTADTKVKLVDGRDLSFKELIKEYNDKKQNFTFTIKKDGTIGVAEIKSPRLTKKNAEIMKVILDNGEEIKCTLNHRFMLKNGNYKEAKDLNSGDSLMPLYFKDTKEDNMQNFREHLLVPEISVNMNHKVDRVEFLKEYADVYDLTIDKTHNFALASGVFVHNSLDGDSAAASRYTEAKLSKISSEMLEDIDKDTVPMRPNFDNSVDEPEILPAKLPNLLLNGATGIAVGMATNIPPHNLTELCDAIASYIDKPKIIAEELAEIVTGPDFPTGGYAMGSGIKDIYTTGKGRIVMRGRTTLEENKGKQSIIITEIPYMVNKADLVMDIAKLATEKKLPDVYDLRDESSKKGVRIVVELRKGVDSKYTLNKLYTLSKLQSNFDANILALVNNQPKILNLRDVIQVYVDYRKKVVIRRSKFDLKKAEDRLEIVDGLLIALNNIDKVVDFIKKSKNATEAHQGLISKFKLSDRQAKAVLEMKLQQLTKLEDGKLSDEKKKLKETIEYLNKVLASENEVLRIIKKEVNDLKKNYGDARRTRVIKKLEEIKEKDIVEKKDVVVMITNAGYIKRVDVKTYREQRRGGAGVTGVGLKDEDFVRKMLTCSTHDYLLFFTDRGRVYWMKANSVPAAERQSKGRSIANILNLRDENIANVISLKNFDVGYLFFATKLGIVKKLPLKDVSKPRATGVRVINLPLDGSDVIINVVEVVDKQQVLLISKKGQAERFNSDDVRGMGRASYGVKGIELAKNDEVVSVSALPLDEKTTILTITDKGFGKRSELEDYRKTARGGKGVINLKVNDKTGNVVKSLSVDDKDSVIITTSKGMTLRTSMKDLRVMGRATQGVHVVRLKDGDKVVDIVKVPREDKIVSSAEEEGK